MIKLEANISESQWRDQFPPPKSVLAEPSSKSEFLDNAAPLTCQIVTIQHPGFPNALWHLRLPEKIATDNDATTGSYQVGIKWSKTTDGWLFEDLPLAGLEGTLQGMIAADRDTVSYSLTVTNQSTQTWPRALAWLCFNHSLAQEYYQYRNFVFSKNGITQTPPDLLEHYCLQGHHRDWWTHGKIEPTEALIATSCRDDADKEFSVGIGASEAMMVGQNPDWPCTDIGLFFGDVSPGQTARVDGRIYFHYGPPVEILRLYQKDLGK